MMKEWNDMMGCTRNECNHLNELVANINQHLGTELFELESTEDYENECVDLFQGGDLTTTYLEGVQIGVLLKRI